MQRSKAFGGTKPQRRTGAKMIGHLAAGSLGPLLRRRGLSQADLLRFWPDIVGDTLAIRTVPERIVWPRRDGSGARAKLVVRCDPSQALVFEYQRALVIERVNAFLGYAAIDRLQIRQAPVRIMPPRADVTPATLPEADEKALEARLADVDERLRDSLMTLGRAIALRRQNDQ